MFTVKIKSREWSFQVLNNFLNLSSFSAFKYDRIINLVNIPRRNISIRSPQHDSHNPTKDLPTGKMKESGAKNKRPTFFDVVTDKIKMEDIAFKPVHPEKYHDVILHLRYNFFADEPLNRSLNLCEPGQPNEDLEDFSLNVLRQGISFMAVLKNTGQVVGALLNGVEHEEKVSSYDKETLKDEKLQKIFDFLQNVGNDVEALKQYKLSSIFELKIISVDFRFRGRGIAGKLYELAEKFARDKGYKLLRTDATALFSQKLFEKYGFVTLKKIIYAQYPTEENPMFNTEYPHLAFKLMVKKLD